MKTQAKRLNVATATTYEKNGEEVTHWTNIGSAFESEKGITVLLNALPINGKLFISEPKEFEQKEQPKKYGKK